MATTHYIWDVHNDSYLMEHDGLGTTLAEYTHEPTLYASLISEYRDGITNTHHFDAQQSTRQLTNQNQDVDDTYEYSSFGRVLSHIGNSTQPFRYKSAVGYYSDLELDTIYIRHRTLSPGLGRWQSQDPLQIRNALNRRWARHWNKFIYVHNDPIQLGDPSGLVEDVCCECEELKRQMLGEHDYQYDFYLIESKKNKCRVNINCEPIKSCNGHPGHTSPPKPVANNDDYNYEIDVCVSCRFKPTDLVFHHEMFHARTYCSFPELDLSDCDVCRRQERLAHLVNCNIEFFGKPDKFKRCLQCGIAMSCRDACEDIVRDEKGNVFVDGRMCDMVTDMGATVPWTPDV